MKVGLLFRGDRRDSVLPSRAATQLGPLFSAFADFGVEAVAVAYADEAVDEVRGQLARLDGVLVWVNPIQDGADRSQLDELLREVANRGVWVSAHPDVILAIGTKEVLYRTRMLSWGTDTDLYRSAEELAARFPKRLASSGRRVVKQGRGNGRNGVWSVELLDGAGPEKLVRVRHAVDRDGAVEELTLGAFLARCNGYFAWSGCVVDQPYVDRLADGMVRVYFVHDVVVGFCHQWPRGLLDTVDGTADGGTPPVTMKPADEAAYQPLRYQAEQEWIPAMTQLLSLDTEMLAVIWDADLLYGPKTDDGHDTYVLCEINTSAVWPYPPSATPALAKAALARISANRPR